MRPLRREPGSSSPTEQDLGARARPAALGAVRDTVGQRRVSGREAGRGEGRSPAPGVVLVSAGRNLPSYDLCPETFQESQGHG